MHVTVGSLLEETQRSLAAAHIPDPRTESEWLLGDLLALDRTRLYLSRTETVPADAAQRMQARVSRRLAGEPVQYIVGRVPFMDCILDVGPAVLIPRPETELLAEEARALVKPGMRVLDIGTGSGALAVAVAKACPDCRVTGLDVSGAALEVARGNAAVNGVGDRIGFVRADIREDAALSGTYHLVVTNPPYIPSRDIAGLQEEVRCFEPALALDGGADGLDFYRVLARRAAGMLEPGGVLLAEVGAGQAPEVERLFAGSPAVAGCRTVSDYAGHGRIVIVNIKETVSG